mgnify:CR=1 FL=1
MLLVCSLCWGVSLIRFPCLLFLVVKGMPCTDIVIFECVNIFSLTPQKKVKKRFSNTKFKTKERASMTIYNLN